MAAYLLFDFKDSMVIFYCSQRCKVKEVVFIENSNQEICCVENINKQFLLEAIMIIFSVKISLFKTTLVSVPMSLTNVR